MNLAISPDLLPQHIAIIMDGNGRWAKERGKPRIWGHHEGAKTVRRITEECAKLGISQLTLYAFSYENWQRPEKEIKYLMTLLRRFLILERKTIMKNNIRFTAIGKLDRLPLNVRQELEKTKSISSGNTGMTMCLALSYGGRREITDAVKNIAMQVKSGDIEIDDIDEKLVQQNLYQPDMVDPDLLIRTGGDMRISNFLLWQISYTELVVFRCYWPDFSIKDLHQTIREFSLRERRFGKVITKSAQSKSNSQKIMA